MGWAIGAIPVVLVLLIFFSVSQKRIEQTQKAFRILDKRGRAEMVLWDLSNNRIRALCQDIDPQAIVAAVLPLPWGLHYWCGNTTIAVPTDLRRERVQKRFFAETGVRYLVLDERRSLRSLTRLPALVEISKIDSFTLYELSSSVATPGSWAAPNPLSCAGGHDHGRCK